MLGIVVGLAAEARVARGLGGRVAVGGGSAAGAADATRRLVADGATALLSFGLAGGLDPALPAGTVVVPGAVIDQHGNRWATDSAFNAMLEFGKRPADDGGTTLLASASIIGTASQKQALWRQFAASAADMESGAVAGIARQAQLPFAVLRAICDPADADLPPAALTALNAAGQIGAGKLVRSLIRQPGQMLALIRLGRQAAQARAALLRRVACHSPLVLPPPDPSCVVLGC